MRIAESWTGAAAVARQWRKSSLVKRPWQLRWKPICASTETALSIWLRDKPLIKKQPRALFAGRQTCGRGQYGRFWSSPVGGVWMSAAFPCDELKHSSVGLLGLAVAVALAERIELKGVDVYIKWPNDLVVANRKLAGVLPRLVHRGSDLVAARIGIGLNVCNRVPVEGVSLAEILRRGVCHPVAWAAEVLLAMDRAMDLVSDANNVCIQAENRLASRLVNDPETGEEWQISKIEINGSLRVKKASIERVWTRWS